MLKSYSTQFALTFFFGPPGLAYSSMAVAVVFTLMSAVLFFNVLGLSALLIAWPMAILCGLLLVKLHNERQRQVGYSLLVSRERLNDIGTMFAAWTRGFAVLAVLLGAGFVAWQYGPNAVEPVGKMVENSGVSNMLSRSGERIASFAQEGRASIAQIVKERAEEKRLAAEQQQQVAADAARVAEQRPVRNVVEIPASARRASGASIAAASKTDKTQVSLVSVGEVSVTTAMANLRDGPGMQFPIVATATEGEVLVQFARQGDWLNVKVKETGRNAWVFNSLVGAE